MTCLFFISLFFIFYVYIGYPATVAVYALFNNKGVQKSDIEPYITIIVAAYNEADCIADNIENKRAMDYPIERVEIIVVSDGSEDGTDDIVRKFSDSGVKLIRQEPRAGKTSALNLAVSIAKGEIIVFSDANSLYDRNAIKKLVRNFHDPSVGYVTGKMIYINPDGTTIGDGCSAYMKYENLLRKMETKIGSIVGVDGGVDAIRKELYQPMNPDQLPDFVLPLKVIDQGYRVVYESEAILCEPALNSSEDEYRMRVRVALRALWALRDMRHLLTGSASHLFSFQLWSHKVLRYLCFVFLAGAYISNVVLLPCGLFYIILFVLQTSAYTGAAISPLLDKKGCNIKLFYLAYYFALINLASAHAFIKFIMGQKMVTWTPRKG